MINTSVFWIICICMLVVGLISNVLSWILNKYYKKKMGSMADMKKADK